MTTTAHCRTPASWKDDETAIRRFPRKLRFSITIARPCLPLLVLRRKETNALYTMEQTLATATAERVLKRERRGGGGGGDLGGNLSPLQGWNALEIVQMSYFCERFIVRNGYVREENQRHGPTCPKVGGMRCWSLLHYRIPRI